jgi:hypothetical protein
MHKSLIITASLATLLVSTSAFAANPNATGIIKHINFHHHTVTLKGGKTYVLPANFNLKSLKGGEKVTVSYVVKDKRYIATSVKAA